MVWGTPQPLPWPPMGEESLAFMTKEQYTKFRGRLEVITRQWHFECLGSNLSAGFMIELTGATCGTGSLLSSAINIGPFIY